LIRDGIYDSLLKARRRELHRRAADWFAARDAILHAEHLDRAEDPAAPQAYLTAARRQARDHHYTRALTLVERGLELAEAGAGAFELMCTRGDVLRELGSIDLSIACFESAASLAQAAVEKCRAMIGLASGMRVVGRLEDALGALDQAEAIAREQNLAGDVAQIHHLRGNLYFPLGRIDGCLEQHQLALSLAREARATELEARALGGLADANYMRGRMLTAYDQYRRCVDLARERGLGSVEIANWAMVGCAQRYTNQLQEAWDDSLEAIESAVNAGNQRAEIVARQNAWLLRDMARFAEAKPHFERALALARGLGAKLFEPLNMTELAFIAAAEGDSGTASTLIEAAWSASRESRPAFLGGWILGVRARITENPDIREDSFREGERLLSEGCVGHNYYWFYSDAIEAAWRLGDWNRMERYASALEAYTRQEPTPWSDWHIARGRALAAYGRGRRDEPLMAHIRELADDARRVGLHLALPALEQALAP
jgi:tetratricopeptide (TPR) repeat protein